MMRQGHAFQIALVVSVALILILAAALVFLLPALDFSSDLLTALGALVGALGSVGAGFFSTDRRYKRRDRRQVFLSYAHEDREVALRLAAAVRNAGYNPWLDSLELPAGQVVSKAIEEAVRQSGAALLVAPSEDARGAQQFELQRLLLNDARAMNRNVSAVLPVLVSKSRASAIPGPLKDLQWIDLENPNWEGQLSQYLHSAFG